MRRNPHGGQAGGRLDDGGVDGAGGRRPAGLARRGDRHWTTRPRAPAQIGAHRPAHPAGVLAGPRGAAAGHRAAPGTFMGVAIRPPSETTVTAGLRRATCSRAIACHASASLILKPGRMSLTPRPVSPRSSARKLATPVSWSRPWPAASPPAPRSARPRRPTRGPGSDGPPARRTTCRAAWPGTRAWPRPPPGGTPPFGRSGGRPGARTQRGMVTPPIPQRSTIRTRARPPRRSPRGTPRGGSGGRTNRCARWSCRASASCPASLPSPRSTA